MRLRYIPGQYEFLKNHERAVTDPEKRQKKLNSIFDNNNLIHVELGCGKGQFIRGLAVANPDINYLGFENSVKVAYRCVKSITEDDPSNFYIVYASGDILADIFAPRSIGRIYLNFSDPWPKPRHCKRRLTHPDFLKIYETVLLADGQLHMKTDNDDLFEYSLEKIEDSGWQLLEVTRDLYNSPSFQGNIATEYEERFAAEGKSINKLIAAPPVDRGGCL